MKRVWVVVLLSFGLATSAAAQRTTGRDHRQGRRRIGQRAARRHGHAARRRRGRRADGRDLGDRASTGFRCCRRAPTASNTRSPDSARSNARRFRSPSASIVELDVTMKVGALEESITVSGASPVVNVASSEVSTTYNREWVENAPVRRFSYFDLINSAPGVSATSNVGQSHGGAVARQQHQRELVPDRRHRHQLDAVAEHRRGRGSRSAAARRVGRVRQRPGRGLQHRHAPGRQRVPRRRQLLLADRRADRPEHDRRASTAAARITATRGATRPSRRRDRSSGTSSGSSARCSTSETGTRSRASIRTTPTEERRAARVLEVQLQHHAEPSADARLSRRLLLHPRHRDLDFTAPSTDRPEPRRQPDAEPGLHRRAVGQDASSRRATPGFCLHSSQRSATRRAARACSRGSRTRTPVTSPAASRTGSRTAAGATATRRSCRT